MSANDVYRFVDQLQRAGKEKGAIELVLKLDNALSLGSSGLEILGAIRQTIIENRKAIEGLIPSDHRNEIAEVIIFVDKAYGRG